MDIIPAIDLKNKKCVRLYKGEYEKSVTYNEDPIPVSYTHLTLPTKAKV